MLDHCEFLPDDKICCAVELFKSTTGMKFTGTGFYTVLEDFLGPRKNFRTLDTLLVLPNDGYTWEGSTWLNCSWQGWKAASAFLPTQQLIIYLYYVRSPASAFDAIVKAPVRVAR